jgi:TM2 domain-containing membrane protein YozV
MDSGVSRENISPMTGPYRDLPAPSEKSRGVATALATLLGPFGAHRFYLGKPESGAVMLLTLGGLGIWWLYDLILIASGSFRDGEGRLVTRWDPEEVQRTSDTHQILEELDALRAEMAELQERVDFTERLLAQPRDDEPVARPRPIRPA